MPPQQQFGGRRRFGFSGMTWMWIALGVFFATGAGLSMFVKQRPNIPGTPVRSYFGVDGFQTTDGGVTFDVVEPEGGPADKAGLVGGDIITSLDGHPVRTIDEIIGLLAKTPIGATVEVIYIRDGVTKKTQLTTESEGGIKRLQDVGDRPAGMFGFEREKSTRISVPGNQNLRIANRLRNTKFAGGSLWNKRGRYHN